MCDKCDKCELLLFLSIWSRIIRMKELNFQEQAFKACYLQHFKASRAAKEAGYSDKVAETHAWSWVSITGCPPNKVHLRDAIHAEIKEAFGEEEIDVAWVLRRAKLIADFNICKFLRKTDGGNMVYDFSDATMDDWYCVEEYVTEQSYRRAAGGEQVPVDKLKIKTTGRDRALRLIGDLAPVAAFVKEKEDNPVDNMVDTLNKLVDKLPGA